MVEKQLRWFERVVVWRWWIIGAVGVFILLFEIVESIEHPQVDFYHIIEILLFYSLLVLIGLLFGRLYRSMKAQFQTTKLLETKHQVSLQFAHALDWDELTENILQNFASIIQPTCAYLLVHDPACSAFGQVAELKLDNQDCSAVMRNLPADSCMNCTLKGPTRISALKHCEIHSGEPASNAYDSYCLPLEYGNSLVAVIHYHLPTGTVPSENQVELMNSIGFEMAISLVMAQQRKIVADIKMVEAALAERRSFSRDLHDTLGQNLAFLRMKLDHFATNGALQSTEDSRAELVEMRSIADESLALVRGMLTVLKPDAQGHLEKLICDYSQIVANPENILIDIQCEGKPRQIDSQIENQILYIYREALNNIVRHAQASQVEVVLNWSERDLMINIHDNGNGFNPQQVDSASHFGLTIMKERTEMLKGKFELDTASNTGTWIKIWLPI
ncbi:MAG: histidine kinase [Chloroflexi bacterium]|nr:histidine kinase [Chloroflexota bacterium]